VRELLFRLPLTHALARLGDLCGVMYRPTVSRFPVAPWSPCIADKLSHKLARTHIGEHIVFRHARTGGVEGRRKRVRPAASPRSRPLLNPSRAFDD
jgi:hypothetical protein